MTRVMDDLVELAFVSDSPKKAKKLLEEFRSVATGESQRLDRVPGGAYVDRDVEVL